MTVNRLKYQYFIDDRLKDQFVIVNGNYPWLLMTENIMEVLGLQISNHFEPSVKPKKVQSKG